MTDPTLLRRAIESVGIEKRSDYTLVMEEVERLMSKRLLERCGAAVKQAEAGQQYLYENVANAVLVEAGFYTLIRAATDLVKEAEEMGFGKTSEKALPGSFDALVQALTLIGTEAPKQE